VGCLDSTFEERARLFLSPINGADLTKESEIMLWTILVILLVLWLLGFIGHIGGGLIHILLVVAVIVLIYNLVAGRRSV
jgi:hypothetical protein